MKIPVDVSNLPASVRDCLIQSMKPKFHGYFEFTRDTRRSIPRWDSGGKAFFEYPNASMISDITMLWTLLNELYENIKSSVVDVDREIAQLFAANDLTP